jgi:hypothetical protein
MALKQRGVLCTLQEIGISSRQEGGTVLFQVPTQIPEAVERIFGKPWIVTCPSLP